MITVGITGGIGSGKTTIAKYFSSEFGIPVYYADTEAKALMNTEALRKPIKELLGEAAYVEEKLDRKYVASKVFNDRDLLEQLNQIVHPAVGEHFKKWISQQDAPYILKEAAILFENGTASALDYIILITAPKKLRIQRVLERDDSTVEDIENRMNKQWDDVKKIPLADFIIENIELDNSKLQAKNIHRQILRDRVNT
ncbi:dephospho-CoA kinase [Leeuwenhoekiella marinoflava]|uniref:Dephospho-CoA kinase n=2 Tax=Leeuwenhoekiella marinoflava TaxID=988 RepID=A0A4Q0PQQ9_9FLAO|nr:dephospho-CoA kinase [Leeuwenhoekiella marinoflava]RXG32877.1 dephospho-CoA kinase [Leeuwenhoekiella marinoflava]SHE59983.1 dephospho-CoA kinase [Leeuwenhoekiella marinoflava DSM 3653]